MFKLPELFHTLPEPEIMAAVDLGSNSFHMIVTRITDGHIHVVDRLREMVRLGAGLDKENCLTEEAQQRALTCLARFGERLRDIPEQNVRIVGTNTLRLATNAAEFLYKAEVALEHPIEIISGREEARLIYSGVANALAGSNDEKRLVIDIGGGSTEFIIGQQFETLHRESLSMGCVSMSQRFFPEGEIKAKAMRRAEIAALLELQPIESMFRKAGWEHVIGASGTLKTVARVIYEMGWGTTVTPENLQKLRKYLLETGHVNKLKLKGLNNERAPVFPGGVAVLLGIFEGLNIQSMEPSDGALREGLIYDLLGRFSQEDRREQMIHTLTQRYFIDTQQAERVENTIYTYLPQVAEVWGLANEESAHMLSWGARLHEIGLSISHDQYHKHGEYLLTYADLAGFSRQEQLQLAALVRTHRRKFSLDACVRCEHIPFKQMVYLCVLLRLAVLLNRSRHEEELPVFELVPQDNSLHLRFPPNWLEQHPLTYADLEQERSYLKDIRFELSFA